MGELQFAQTSGATRIFFYKLINDEAVYRTAPATPGLLNTFVKCKPKTN